MSRESVFNSVSDTGNPTKLWLRRHDDHYVYMSVKFFLIGCKNCQRVNLEFASGKKHES